ncbi:MAG: ADP-ribosylglycohydrolase family protein, partial [Eubacterium sp.]|nr:ADP-ribosylglycohydrolase family protein [Eubacterium sp.]
IENIHRIGEGWVAEETLGIALYCALKYQNDFSSAIIASVNHNGDSDSTGAVTGNILGALLGYKSIEEKWKTHLELKDVILELANDIYQDSRMETAEDYQNPKWIRKYVDMTWK